MIFLQAENEITVSSITNVNKYTYAHTIRSIFGHPIDLN